GSAYTCGTLCNVYFYDEFGMSAIQYVTDGTDFIIPTFIVNIFNNMTLGDVFVSLFLVSLICASISTISGLMHTIGSAGGYDAFSTIKMMKNKNDKDETSVNVNRVVTLIMMVVVVIYCYYMPSDIIAKATSVFMGLTAAALLPAYVHAIYSKNPCKPAAIASIVAGTVSYLFWALFINSGTSIFLPIYKFFTGDAVIFDGLIKYVDALVVSLPLSIIVMAVALFIVRSKERSVQDAPVAAAVSE
ncbi:MAG: sodium:solute symporter family protein, partial [Candidatus Methanomethylophilaceae archaeon]|nr:sodium:solute symporter family protein [Candidatus Methanomethylophilaceae archaeon]